MQCIGDEHPHFFTPLGRERGNTGRRSDRAAIEERDYRKRSPKQHTAPPPSPTHIHIRRWARVFHRVQSTTNKSTNRRAYNHHATHASTALRQHPGCQGQAGLPLNRAMRLTGSSGPSTPLLRIRAARLALHEPGWTACPDPGGPHSGSCSRAEAVASVVQVTGSGLDACRMTSKRRLTRPRSRPSETL